MKHILLSTLFLSAMTPSLLASVKLDGPAAQRLDATMTASMPVSRSGEVRALPAADPDEKALYAVEMVDEASAMALAEKYNTLSVRANLALVLLDAEEVQELAADPDSRRIELGGMDKNHLIDAREATGVDLIHDGAELPDSYTGAGVIVGMMDTGLDINHINFRDDNGEPRAERLWVITGNNGSVQTFSTPEAIKNYTVDNTGGTHGTHVLGIMGGGFRGRVTRQATINERTGRVQVLAGNNKYYGVAPDAILAPCCGTLHGNNSILAGERLSAFAKEKGLPAVMNFSLGHNTGPHDGSTAHGKFFAELGKEMIICISAGNEGEEPISLHKNFTTGNTTVKTFMSKSASFNGVVDIWGSDSTPFTMTFVVVDKATGETVFSYAIDKPTNGQHILTGSYYTAPGYYHDPVFDKLFSSQSAVIVTGGVDSSNNRYNTYCSFQLSASASASNYVVGVVVEGEPTKSVDLYSSDESTGFTSNGLSGYSNGNADQSINDLACGENVIAVGAYVNTQQWPTTDSGMVGFQGVVKGSIASFSSYGKTFQGEQLPFICGPGMGMRSSYSDYYLTAHPEDDQYISAYYQETKRNNKWMEMSGTSMSSPFVAGVCALWLQADPTLTVDRVKEAMAQTATQDEFTAKDPYRWGVGKINAYEGLKYVLDQASVSNVKADNEILVTALGGNSYEVFAPAGNIRAELFSLSGSLVSSQSAGGNTLAVSADGVAPGVYVLRATAGNQVKTRKITVR